MLNKMLTSIFTWMRSNERPRTKEAMELNGIEPMTSRVRF